MYVRTLSRRPREEEPSSPVSNDDVGSTATSSKRWPYSSTASMLVPGKLSSVSMEAMLQRAQAQKAALEVLRNGSTMENASATEDRARWVDHGLGKAAPSPWHHGWDKACREFLRVVDWQAAISAFKRIGTRG